MRILIHNAAAGVPGPRISPEDWQQAAARAGIEGHQVRFSASPAELRAGLGDTEILLTGDTHLARYAPFDAPALKIISVVFAGLDFMAPFDWLPPGVILLNNSGTHARKAGEYIAMALLALANNLPHYAAAQQAREWSHQRGRVLADGRATIVGLGALGGSGAHWARQFGMQVTGVRTSTRPHPDCHRVVATSALDEVLPQTDYLVLAAPLTDATRGLITRKRLEALPAGAGLVNVGRGALVDQEAVCDLLDAGRLGGAVLDVFNHEPIPPDHRLWRTSNLLITPHMSADDPIRYVATSLDIFLRNLGAFQAGQALPNRFDPLRGY